MSSTTPTFTVTNLPPRIAAKIAVDPVTGCWLWRGATNSCGYGHAWWCGGMVQAHRLTFHLLADPTLLVSPGPAHGSDLDHGCRVRPCVNPEHLEIVTNRENAVRGLKGVLGNHSSRFVGVHWHVECRRWQAQITLDGRQRHLGYFRDEVAAAITYDSAAEAHFGERTNERLGLLAGYLDDDEVAS